MAQKFIETIRFEDGQPRNLELHQQRFEATRRHFFGSRCAPELARTLRLPAEFRAGTVKCRVIFQEKIEQVEFEPYAIRPLRTLALADGTGLDYGFKFQDRAALDFLKKQAAADEILIVQNGFLTDSSFSNLAFSTDGRDWLTPETCLLNGTQRQFLLETKRLRACPIRPDDLPKFRFLKFINAMLDLDNSPAIPLAAGLGKP